MQKVTYVNLYGEAITFSGDAPYILASVSGLSRSSGKLVTSQGAYQDGQTIYRAQLAAKKVAVTFNVFGCGTREELYKKRERIEHVLSYGRCVKDGKCGYLIYENDAGAWRMDAVPDGAVTYGKRFLNSLPNCRVSFTSAGAYLSSNTEETKTMSMGKGGLKLPTKLPIHLGTRLFETEIVNEGSVEAPVMLTIYGTGESPKVVNYTTGEQIVVNKIIETGSRLEIDTDPDKLSCVLIDEDGTQTDAFGYLDASMAVSAFTLAPGINNVEYLPSVPSMESRVDVRWRARREGV